MAWYVTGKGDGARTCWRFSGAWLSFSINAVVHIVLDIIGGPAFVLDDVEVALFRLLKVVVVVSE